VNTYTIGTLAKNAGLNVETIRYYQRRGLVEEPKRPLQGIRRYTDSHARRLRFIREAQKLGFSLDEVRELLALEDGSHCREAERIGASKLATVRTRLVQLRRVERALTNLVTRCRSNRGTVCCPLIAALERDQRRRPKHSPGVPQWTRR
jgi:MerR family mercuric resistance operon transcriptional regulator